MTNGVEVGDGWKGGEDARRRGGRWFWDEKTFLQRQRKYSSRVTRTLLLASRLLAADRDAVRTLEFRNILDELFKVRLGQIFM